MQARAAACEAPVQKSSSSRDGDRCLRHQRRDACLMLDGQLENHSGFFSAGVPKHEDIGRMDKHHAVTRSDSEHVTGLGTHVSMGHISICDALRVCTAYMHHCR